MQERPAGQSAVSADAGAHRRPVLDVALTLLIRSSGELQLGWDPDRAVLIRPPGGVNAHELAALLLRADGSRSCAELAQLEGAVGIDGAELNELIEQLVDGGLLRWAPRTSPPRTGVLHVHGRGPLCDALCAGLALSGIRPTRSCEHLTLGRRHPELVVLADELVPDPCLLAELVGHHISHLSVRLRDGVGVVGPLVLPGRTSCLRCADLHRAEHDPEWPRIAAQLLGRVGHGSVAAVGATVGIALGQIEQLLDDRRAEPAGPPTVNATIEVDPRRAQLRRRVWSPHPRCGCGAHR